MSTATMRARFLCATWICKDPPVKVGKGAVDPHVDAPPSRSSAPAPRPGARGRAGTTDRELLRMAQRFLTSRAQAAATTCRPTAPSWPSRALRHLLLSGPDACLC